MIFNDAHRKLYCQEWEIERNLLKSWQGRQKQKQEKYNVGGMKLNLKSQYSKITDKNRKYVYKCKNTSCI